MSTNNQNQNMSVNQMNETEESTKNQLPPKKRKRGPKKKQEPKSTKDLDMYFDNSELKRFLNISSSTLIRYRKANYFPYVIIGKKYYYLRDFFQKSTQENIINKHLLDKKTP